MRKFYMLSFLTFLFAGSVIAQEVLEVAKGLGTLNTAIATYGGTRIYKRLLVNGMVWTHRSKTSIII